MQLIENHYNQNRNKLLKRLTFRTGGDSHKAEDILQESYLRALKYYNEDRVEEFDKWFSTIVNSAYNDIMRDDIGMSYIDEDDEPLGSIDCSILGQQTLKEVYELISTKAIPQMEILTLHLRYGFSAIDISRQTEYSYAQVHKTIQRFKQELETLYK